MAAPIEMPPTTARDQVFGQAATSSVKVAIVSSDIAPRAEAPCPRHSSVIRRAAGVGGEDLCGLRGVAAEPVLEEDRRAPRRHRHSARARPSRSNAKLCPSRRLPRIRRRNESDDARLARVEAMGDQRGRRSRPAGGAHIMRVVQDALARSGESTVRRRDPWHEP